MTAGRQVENPQRFTLMLAHGSARSTGAPSQAESLAAETGREVDQLCWIPRANSTEHDDWFRREVEKGRAAAREGRLLDDDGVASAFHQRYRG